MATETQSARTIFREALEQRDPGERARFIDAACNGDSALHGEVVRLLAAHDDLNSFMVRPAAGAATIDLPPTEQIGATIGRYKLLEQIGEGGMGVVYVAEQTEPVRRRVALKIIKPGMDTRQVIARFEAERQALAMMDHPNIAKVLDGGATEPPLSLQGRGAGSEGTGRPYFVMELVRGMPITDYCDQAKLNPRGRLALFVTVCHAVQHAHQKGVIHRDLKPSNVLVTMHDGHPVAKVIDFGVAKATGRNLTDRTIYTAFTELIGTPLYMSPEQAELSGLDVDTRSDVYSLGVLLYELLTGHTPFDRETLVKSGLDEIRRMIREDEPPRPSHRISTLAADAGSTVSQKRGIDQRQLTRAIKGELDWIVMKALEKDRNRRYESASAFAADIERYLNNEPVEAGPPSALYRFRKFARRRRAAVISSAIVAASVLMVAGVSAAAAWQLAHKANELQLANQRIARQRDRLERVLFGVVAQNRLSDALHEPGVEQTYRTRVQFVKESLGNVPSSPILHLLAANALLDGIYEAENDGALSKERRASLSAQYTEDLSEVLSDWARLENQEPALMNTLAWIHVIAPRERLRNHRLATELGETLQRRFPTHGPYLNTLALAYFRAGRYQEAVDLEKQALEKAEQTSLFAWAHTVIAMSLAKLGQGQEAQSHLRLVQDWTTKRRSRGWHLGYLIDEAAKLIADAGD
jgi:serine/threonine protein kinase